MNRLWTIILAVLFAFCLADSSHAAKPKGKTALEARLNKMGFRTAWQAFGKGEKSGKNLYFEVPSTKLPGKKANGKPKWMGGYWTVMVVLRTEPVNGKFDAATENALAMAKHFKSLRKRDGGTIYVFIDPSAPIRAAEAMAELAHLTGRTFTYADCNGLERGLAVDCRDRFAKWGIPKYVPPPKLK